MQNKSERPQWPWDTRPVTCSVPAWCPTTLQYQYQLLTAEVTWPIHTTMSMVTHSTTQWIPGCHSFSWSLPIIHQVIHNRWTLIQTITQASGPLLLPSMEVGHMKIQVPHMGEWMIGRWTTHNPAIERTLAIRVVRTIGLVFHQGLLYLITLTTERANEPSLDLGSHLSTILGPMVLTHPLGTSILLTTVRACNLVTSHTSLCVLHPHPPGV